jgi:microcompartment protein CcmL/EutN
VHLPDNPALALVEVSSIARAHVVGDAMVKRAEVEVLLAAPVTPGKYLVLIAGPEANVDESWRAGCEVAGEQLVDELLLPGVHAELVAGLMGARGELHGRSVLIAETRTVASTLLAVDGALKAADVALLDLRLAVGIGGKGAFRLAGRLPDAQAAAAAVQELTGDKLVALELIAQPDPAFPGGLSHGED